VVRNDILFNFNNSLFKHGDLLNIRPFYGVESELLTKIEIVDAYQPIPIHLVNKIRRVSFKNTLSEIRISKIRNHLKQISHDYDEIWHKDYGEIDSGNLIDDIGDTSSMLNELAKCISWTNTYPRFDKIHLRKKNNFNLNEFHTDHYNSDPERTRLLGTMERAIINLGKATRWFAILDIPDRLVQTTIFDPYHHSNYEKLLSSLSVINLILIETHKSTYDECLHGLVFNAFECIHSGYGTKGDFSAILSNWKSF
jgi:hypothetical protein